jgi:sugar/nucleoside kinase (ribokinase family)
VTLQRRKDLKVGRVYRSSSERPGRDEPASGDAARLVVVGAASRDLAEDDPRGWRLGGSATYCSLAAALLGLRVGCLLGVDSLAGEADELALLESAGVDLRRVRLDRGPVFENLEADGQRRQRWRSRSDALPAALPAEWRDASGWLLVPVAGEVGRGWEVEAATAAARGVRIGVGWQGLLRSFDDDGWVRRVAPGDVPEREAAIVAAAGLVCASVDDVPSGMPLAELQPFAPGATIVLTAGENGGAAIRRNDLVRYRAIPAAGKVDPTGAGDVFLAALMMGWIQTGEQATDATLRFAAAAASCSVEGLGLAGVPTSAQVSARLLLAP